MLLLIGAYQAVCGTLNAFKVPVPELPAPEGSDVPLHS
jgi:hypothetical protein